MTSPILGTFSSCSMTLLGMYQAAPDSLRKICDRATRILLRCDLAAMPYTWKPYFQIGAKTTLYILSLLKIESLFPGLRSQAMLFVFVLRRRVTSVTWCSNVSLLSRVTPRYLWEFNCVRSSSCRNTPCDVPFLRMYVTETHFSGLTVMFQQKAQFSNFFK